MLLTSKVGTSGDEFSLPRNTSSRRSPTLAQPPGRRHALRVDRGAVLVTIAAHVRATTTNLRPPSVRAGPQDWRPYDRSRDRRPAFYRRWAEKSFHRNSVSPSKCAAPGDGRSRAPSVLRGGWPGSGERKREARKRKRQAGSGEAGARPGRSWARDARRAVAISRTGRSRRLDAANTPGSSAAAQHQRRTGGR